LPALGVEILRHAVGQVGVLFLDVDVREKVVFHVVAVGIRVFGREADVLVEVEGAGLGEVEPFARCMSARRA
jgi:hypothetical protein